MRAQLQHLALIDELPTVTLRVLPATVMSDEAMIGGFTILDFPAAASRASATCDTLWATNARTSPNMWNRLECCSPTSARSRWTHRSQSWR